MSADFIVDPPGKADLEFLDWMPSRGFLHQVLEFIAELVEPALAADLRDFVAGRYAFFALSSYTADQAAEIMAVIRESLPAAAEEWYPGDDGVRQQVAELVEMVAQADAAPSA